MRRKPIDSQAAMAEGVDYLLREFRAMRPVPAPDLPGQGFEQFTGPIEVTYLVAAVDARPEIRALADFVCNGVDDNLEVQAAIDQLKANSWGGTVQLTEGIFFFSDGVNMEGAAPIRLIGAGMDSTMIQNWIQGQGAFGNLRSSDGAWVFAEMSDYGHVEGIGFDYVVENTNPSGSALLQLHYNSTVTNCQFQHSGAADLSLDCVSMGLESSIDHCRFWIHADNGNGISSVFDYADISNSRFSSQGSGFKSMYIPGWIWELESVTFSADGTKAYTVDNVSDRVHQYTLTTAWDISTGSSASKSMYVGDEENTPKSVTFSADGTKAYILGWLNDTVYQYTLGTAWDISTGSYASKSMYVGGQETGPTGVALSADGTKAYIVGTVNNTVYQYTLGTAWDISTGSYASKSLYAGDQDVSSQAVTLSADGTKAYVLTSASDTVYQYTLTVAWDISTGSYASKSLYIGGEAAWPTGVALSTDGTKAYIIDNFGDTVYQYTLTVAWDISTGVPTPGPCAGYAISTDGARYNIIHGNWIYGCAETAIVVAGDGNVVTGNRIVGGTPLNVGIDVASERCVIDSNVIENAEDQGILVTGDHTTVSDNVVKGAAASGDCIVMEGVDSSVTGNILENGYGHGIKIDDGDNTLVAANRIDTMGGDGIHITAATDGTMLGTNLITGVSGDDIVDGGTNMVNTDWLANPFYNGIMLETMRVVVTESAGTVTMALDQASGGDLTMRFSDGRTLLDTTPALTIALTTGSDTSPTSNFIYIPKATKVLTKSTSDFPTDTEHIKVAFFSVPSAAFVAANGLRVFQIWTDHAQDTSGQGHMADISERLRREPAKWHSGLSGAGTTDYLTIVGTTVDLKIASGFVYQMHKHTVPAFDTSTGDMVLVKNWSGDAWHDLTNLYDIVADSTGTTIGNNKYFNLLLWRVANETSTFDPTIINLPAGFYTSLADAENDVDGFDDLTIPREFLHDSSTGFLLARITVQKKTATWEHKSTRDLRGMLATTAVGGAAGVVTDFSDNQFSVFNVADVSKIVALDVSGVATGTTRTLVVPDKNGTIGIDGAIPVKTDTGDPGSPFEGQIYANTFDKKVRVYADAAWRDLAVW